MFKGIGIKICSHNEAHFGTKAIQLVRSQFPVSTFQNLDILVTLTFFFQGRNEQTCCPPKNGCNVPGTPPKSK